MAMGKMYKSSSKSSKKYVKRPQPVVVVKPKRSKSKSSVSLFRNPFRTGQIWKLTYSQQNDLTANGTQTYPLYNIIRANSPYDPDQTGTGNQPRYYDTLFGADNSSAPYRQYRVVRAVAKVSFMSNASTVSAIGDIAVQAQVVGGQVLTSARELSEAANCKHNLIGSGYSSAAIKTITYDLNSKSMSRLLGIKDIKDDEDLVANYNANPASGINFIAYWQPIQSSSVSTITMRWTITYYVEAMTLNDVADS